MPRTDAAAIVDTLTAYWQSATLAAALDLDLFTALGNDTLDADELAARCGGRPDAVATLCRSLTTQGLLTVRRGRFRAPVAVLRLLDARSPHAVGAAYRFFHGAAMVQAFGQLASTVRGTTSARRAVADPREWARFASATWALRRAALRGVAAAVARQRPGNRLLDVGAGASPLGSHLLARLPGARLTVLDHPLVLEAARPLWRTAGLGRRIAARGVDAMKSSWGGPFDAVLMVNVLEYVPAAGRRVLLRKARETLVSGGLLVVCAPIADAGRGGPPEAVDYDLMLLAVGAPGRAATATELQASLVSAGFRRAWRLHRMPVMLARA